MGVEAVGGSWRELEGVGALEVLGLLAMTESNQLGYIIRNKTVTTKPSTYPPAAYTACQFCEHKEADSHSTNISITKASKQCID